MTTIINGRWERLAFAAVGIVIAFAGVTLSLLYAASVERTTRIEQRLERIERRLWKE